MTQKRKAELQRKLSMAPVAKPPSDLADRIKADIPEYLDAGRDRQRLSRSIGFSLRVAASIILLVTSAFFAVEFLSRTDEAETTVTEPVAAIAESAVKDDVQQQQDLDTPAPTPPPQRVVGAGGASPAPPAARPKLAAAKPAETAEAPPPAAPLPAAPPPPPPAVAEMREAVAEAIEPSAGRRRQPDAGAAANDLAVARFEARDDPQAETEVDRLKKLIGEGESPAGVDVGAVIDHFAGPPQPDLHDIRLQVEASRAPLAADDTAVIRYTIDVPAAGTGEQLRLAQLSIALETSIIHSYRTISDVRPSSDENKLLTTGTSVTGLVEVRLAAGTRPEQRVATILLDYVSPASGQKTNTTQPVYARDLERSWQSASRRHRLATLSATWSESLSGARGATGVAEAAAALAQEAPGDDRAQELATLTASYRPRTSSPTGSGR
ncbi:MAG TPA: hypothetical protein VM779_13430 [Thermoanaerobaculia bacterium]|nr:hypothetical protein [Thermoanaerobaculia bacterium]